MPAARSGRYSLPSTGSLGARAEAAGLKDRRKTDFDVGKRLEPLNAEPLGAPNAGRKFRGAARRQPYAGGGARRRRGRQLQTDKNTVYFHAPSLQFKFDDSDGRTEELYQRFWQFQQLPAVYMVLWCCVVISVVATGVVQELKVCYGINILTFTGHFSSVKLARETYCSHHVVLFLICLCKMLTLS